MASGTADLQRDLGGAIMQSLLGAILAAGYAASFAPSVAASPQADQVSSAVENQLLKSDASATDIAAQYPHYSNEIIAAAKSSFLDGANLAYAVGIGIVILGAALVLFCFPRKNEELALLALYAADDAKTDRRQAGSLRPNKP